MSVEMLPENKAKDGESAAEKHDRLRDDSEEEALSLSELAVHDEVEELGESAADDPALTSRPQQPDELFEFFTSNKLYSDMCPADDIIVSGRLLPLKHQCLSHFPHQMDDSLRAENRLRQSARCRRSESLSDLKSISQSNSIKTRVVRSSRSLDDRRQGRSHSSFLPERDRNRSGISDRSSVSSPKVLKSRWQSLIFGIGMVKFPPEMELRDIKSRSQRSNQATLFLSTPESEAKSPASGSTGGKGSSWGLLKALSCKDHTSISVTTSFVCMPHI
uniref:Uncharacterized protein n=1 Tax=Kalanchoe fedtschenkoi TaxID=63787 RepID=A0A7N0SW51_KALFE